MASPFGSRRGAWFSRLVLQGLLCAARSLFAISLQRNVRGLSLGSMADLTAQIAQGIPASLATQLQN
jgi:hypothetical protein